MKSIINTQNISKLPLSYIFILLTIYVCPNLKVFSIGENSPLPAILILLSYSFLSIKEIIICSFLGILTLFSITISSGDYLAYKSTIQSGLVSYYILVIPIILSLIIGRLFAFRFKSFDNHKIIKEIKYIIYFLVFIFFLTGVINYFSPSFLSLFMFTGRTSFNRVTFWFTEPSQSPSVILFLWFFALQFLVNKRFIRFFGKDYYIFLLILITLSAVTSILSLPGTLILQLIFSFLSIVFIYTILKFSRFLINQKIGLKLLLRPTKLVIIGYVLIGISCYIVYRILQVDVGKVSVITGLLSRYGFIEGLNVAGGFRSYLAAVSVYFSLINPLSLPGDWVGTFISDLKTYLSFSVFSPGDDIFMLSKNPINVKPLGWLYFCLYDLGLVGLAIYLYLLIGNYVKGIIRGILRIDLFYISLLVFQIAILLVPVLPSTPSVFIPLIFVSFIHKSSNINNKIYN